MSKNNGTLNGKQHSVSKVNTVTSVTISTETTNINDVRKANQQLGDKLHDMFQESNDVKVAQAAASAYGNVLKCAQIQLIYKKLTGKPRTIIFLED